MTFQELPEVFIEFKKILTVVVLHDDSGLPEWTPLPAVSARKGSARVLTQDFFILKSRGCFFVDEAALGPWVAAQAIALEA